MNNGIVCSVCKKKKPLVEMAFTLFGRACCLECHAKFPEPCKCCNKTADERHKEAVEALKELGAVVLSLGKEGDEKPKAPEKPEAFDLDTAKVFWLHYKDADGFDVCKTLFNNVVHVWDGETKRIITYGKGVMPSGEFASKFERKYEYVEIPIEDVIKTVLSGEVVTCYKSVDDTTKVVDFSTGNIKIYRRGVYKVKTLLPPNPDTLK